MTALDFHPADDKFFLSGSIDGKASVHTLLAWKKKYVTIEQKQNHQSMGKRCIYSMLALNHTAIALNHLELPFKVNGHGPLCRSLLSFKN